MENYKVVILSPTVYANFSPLLSIGKALQQRGCEVWVACGDAFRSDILSEGLHYYPLELQSTKNTGVAQRTLQSAEAAERVEKLLDTSKKGAIETFDILARQREVNVLSSIKTVKEGILRLHELETPDLWIVDQSAYAATAVLHGLQEDFITFCNEHPLSLPRTKGLYGVPMRWLQQLRPDKTDLRNFKKAAKRINKKITRKLNQAIRRIDRNVTPMTDAFHFASPRAVIYNYPNFGNEDVRDLGVFQIFGGSHFEPQELSEDWRKTLNRYQSAVPKILISLGTTFSARTDVVEKLIRSIRKEHEDALIIAAAGGSKADLQNKFDEKVIVEDFLPQRALIPEMDLVIHHGGCGSFTETLYYGKPMLILPFAGDQFDVAYDVKRQGLGEVLNPHNFTEEEVQKKLDWAMTKTDRWYLEFWKQRLRRVGPEYSVDQLRLFKKSRVRETALSA